MDVSADCETNDYESAPLPARHPSEQGVTGPSGCQDTTPRSIIHQQRVSFAQERRQSITTQYTDISHQATLPNRMSHGIDRLENAIGRGYNSNLMTTTVIGAAA
jgi:hypothetical protein